MARDNLKSRRIAAFTHMKPLSRLHEMERYTIVSAFKAHVQFLCVLLLEACYLPMSYSKLAVCQWCFGDTHYEILGSLLPTNLQTMLQECTCHIREKQRGVENSGEGKTYYKTPHQKRFWTLPPMIRWASHHGAFSRFQGFFLVFRGTCGSI